METKNTEIHPYQDYEIDLKELFKSLADNKKFIFIFEKM